MSIRITVVPETKPPISAAFYDQEAELLSVVMACHSYETLVHEAFSVKGVLEIHLNSERQLSYMELIVPRYDWQITEPWRVPTLARENCGRPIVVQGYSTRGISVVCHTNFARNALHLELINPRQAHREITNCLVGSNLIIGVAEKGILKDFWVWDIQEDYACQKETQWEEHIMRRSVSLE